MAGAAARRTLPTMPGDHATSAPAGSKFALAVLVALVVLSPWPFGSAHLRTTQAIALVSLTAALGAFLWDGGHHRLQLPPRAISWPLLGLWALALFQLIPLPETLHRALAPGSAAVWHPDVPAAAAVLGQGPHPISLYPDATRRWLSFATGVVGLALAAAPALRDRLSLLRAATAVVGGAVLVSVYGFVARLAFGSKLYGVWSVPTVTPFGPFVSKNHFAGYVELAALLAVGLATGLADEARRGPGWLSWIDSRRSKWVVGAWGAAFVLVLAVPVSLSRGGVVSLCAGLLVFGLLRFWTRGPSRLSPGGLAASLALALLAAAAIAALLPAEARSRVLTLAGVATDPSGSYRIGVWRDTTRLIGSSPVVGSGFGAYADALPRFKTAAGHLGVEHAENDHLEFLAEGGGLGMLAGGLAALALLLHGLKRLRVGENRLVQALLAGVLAGSAALYVHSAFDFNLRIPSNALMAASFGAVCATRTLPSSAPAVGGRRFVPWSVVLVLAGSLLVALLSHWGEPKWDPAALTRVASSPRADLRRSSLAADAVALLRRRPGRAATWVDQAW
ncbi:MAG TPA: O-antigen ligase family protein, partial [Vicinamibacteria bacterium]|nr:O-antigen ligase family protein [Vicinamibacteria bacterium]